MRCWLFLCTIYVVTYYTDEHLVVLNQNVRSSEKGRNPKGDEKRLENDSSKAEGGESEWGSSQEGNNNNAIQEADDSSAESVEEGNGNGNDQNKDTIKIFDNENGNEKDKARKIQNWMRWASEIAKGNPLDILGTNSHSYQPDKYKDLNRRFVLQYPYADNDKIQNLEYAPPNKEIVPIEAPEELVMLVAKESAMRVAAQPHDPNEGTISKKLLRSGDYWNGIWTEEGQSAKSALRSPNNDPTLGVIKAKIMPGNEFYDVIAKMKKMSPRLLYIINEKEDNDDD